MPAFKDLIEKQFGRLKVLKRETNLKKRTRWLCKCECGTEKIIYSTHLINGDTKSCGCLMREHQHANLENGRHIPGYLKSNWKGCGEFTGDFFAQIKRNRAGGRKCREKLDFNVDVEFLWELFLNQDRKCALSGQELIMPAWKTKGTASLDRIDSTKGYTKDNVQWIHKDINRMKNIFEQDYFIKTCRLIGEYNI